EYEDDEPEDGPVDYPIDGGDDGDDDDGDSSRDKADKEEEEHLAPTDSTIVVPTDEPVSSPEGTEPAIPPPSTNITIRARIAVRPQAFISLPLEVEVERLLAMTTPSPSPPISLSPPSAGERLARCMTPPTHSSPPLVPSPLLPSSGCPTQIQTLRITSTQALIDAVTVALPSPPLPPPLYIQPPVDRRDDIPDYEQPPRKRLCLSTLGSRYVIRESSTARPTRGRGIAAHSSPPPALIDIVTAALPSPPLPPSIYMPPPVDHRDDILESEQPPRKRLCLSTICSRYEIGESSTARPTRGRGVDYGFVSTVDAEARRQRISEVGVIELAELHERDTQDLYTLLEDAQDGDSMGCGGGGSHLIGLSQATHHELQTHRDHVYAHETHIQAHQAQLQLQSTLIQT
ncbi:hypothetical protein Tco_1241177, partial [Tanacetum coccineum]